MKAVFSLLKSTLMLFLLLILCTSCYTYKEVFNDKYYVEKDKVHRTVDSLKKGDWILLGVNDRVFTAVQVLEIRENSLRVMLIDSNGNRSYHPVFIPYIQRLELQVPDPVYTIGSGYSAALLLFFLLI